MEIWRDIEGYEGLYQVSSYGRVKGLNRVTSHGHKLRERIIIGGMSTSYRSVILNKDGVGKSMLIHRLVALSFIPNHNNLPQVNHIDEDKLNNNLDNLEWVSIRRNQNHSKNKKSTSNHPGVYWNKVINKWQCCIRVDGKNKHLGSFKSELDAAFAYTNYCNVNNLE